jgi:PKD repeat protein
MIVALMILPVPALGASEEVGIRTTALSGGWPFTVYFAASVPRERAPGATVDWDFGDGGVSRDPATYHTFVEPGLYNVALTVRFPDGTVSRAAVQILTHSGG